METAVDGSRVSPRAGNALAPRAGRDRVAQGGGAVLSELARAVKARPLDAGPRAGHGAGYAHDWADFSAFCGHHGLAPLPAAPQTLRSISRPWRRSAAARRLVLRPGPSVSRCRLTCD